MTGRQGDAGRGQRRQIRHAVAGRRLHRAIQPDAGAGAEGAASCPTAGAIRNNQTSNARMQASARNALVLSQYHAGLETGLWPARRGLASTRTMASKTFNSTSVALAALLSMRR